VDQINASWNPLIDWLRNIASLQSAAQFKSRLASPH
jgi:hypothetical protein